MSVCGTGDKNIDRRWQGSSVGGVFPRVFLRALSMWHGHCFPICLPIPTQRSRVDLDLTLASPTPRECVDSVKKGRRHTASALIGTVAEVLTKAAQGIDLVFT